MSSFLWTYAKAMVKNKALSGRDFPFWATLADYRRWRRSLLPSANSLTDESPWIPFRTIDRLEAYVKPGMRVFEYGAGGSTLFFARRAAEVVSVDHDPAWAAKVSEALKARKLENATVRLKAPRREDGASDRSPSDPDGYVSEGEEWRGYSFRDYVTAIEEYPAGYFDVVLIDGRARPSCFKHALPKVKPGGWIVWDNTERDYYNPSMRLAPHSFHRMDMVGPIPYLNFFGKATLWRVG
jgi:SAM-dependent methyltransferase